MDPRVARRIARVHHRGQCTRFGDLVTEHVERVASAVPREARSVAWLHDLLELTAVCYPELQARGLTDVEEAALRLLTRGRRESYEAYVLRVAGGGGRAGQIARTVKLADLNDHLTHGRPPRTAPAYAWARRCVLEHLNDQTPTAVAG
jgi:hypothetical protein